MVSTDTIGNENGSATPYAPGDEAPPDVVRVGDLEQVDDQGLRQEPVRLDAAQVDLVDPLGHRGGAVVVVALEDQQPAVA